MAATSLALDLAGLAIRAGEHLTHLSQMHDEVKKPDPIGAEKNLSIAKRLRSLLEDQQKLRDIKEKAETLDSQDSRTLLMVQAAAIQEPCINHCQDFGGKIVSALLLRVKNQYEKAVSALNTYRESHKIADWRSFCFAVSDLKHCTTVMKTDSQNFAEVSQWKLTKEQDDELIALTRSSSELADITLRSNEVTILRQLDSLLASNITSVEKVIALDPHFQRLTVEAQGLLDRAIYVLSTDSRKHNELEWAGFNRYADFKLFRAAFIHMVRMHYTTHHRYMSDPQQQVHFYRQLHARAYGPQSEDPTTWSQKELPYLIPLIPFVETQIEQQNPQKDTGKKTQVPSLFRDDA